MLSLVRSRRDSWIPLWAKDRGRLSVSVSFYFEDAADIPHEFLSSWTPGKARKPGRHATGHISGPCAERHERAISFLLERLKEIAAVGVDQGWLAAHRCELRVYITLQLGGKDAIELDASVVKAMADCGAKMMVDAF